MLWKTGLTRKFTHFREQLRSLAEQWPAHGLRFTSPVRPGIVLHRRGISTSMTNNPDNAHCRRGTIASIVICLIAFGVLMGIRGEFEQLRLQTVIAGCAGAFLGVALYQTKKLWPRNN